ncbi:MAG TPA: copper resistance protein CopC [Kribbella sp.]|nr:copper resistance protein CopC [Kribbella sp.]
MAALLVLFGTALPASAHPTLLSTTPEAGYSVTSAPDRVTMVFDEPVSVAPRAVRVDDDSGRPVDISEVTREQGGRRLVVKLPAELPAARYVVRWEVTAQDGDVVAASFDFAVATDASGLSGREAESGTAFPLSAVARWLFFLSLAGVLGGVAGEWIASRAAPDARRPRSLVRPAAVVGTLAAAGMLGSLVIATGRPGRAGYLLAAEALGLALVALLRSRVRSWLVLAIAVAVISVEALRNHLGTQRGVPGALVIAIHLASISVWVGALVQLLRVGRANSFDSRLRRAFATYARLASALFLLVAASGTLAALLLVPSLDALTATAYGWTLIGKLALVVGVAALAWIARRRLSAASTALIRPVTAEAATIVAVLAVSALLVSLPSPAPATRDLGYPVRATGPVIQLGSLVGQITVGVAASENQLVVRLGVPDDSQTGEGEPPSFHVAASVTGPGSPAAAVVLSPCGRGCFVGPVSWRTGLGHLGLRVDSAGWHGGTVDFPIHWTPLVARDILPRVRGAMLAQGPFRVAEAVSSDTSGPAPISQTVTIDGPTFIESDPYAGPPDPEVVVQPAAGGRRILSFGLPAEGIYVELEVDASYRIVRETLAAPNHLAQRTFSYPR